jgi:transcriptional regulator with GAF, ATPase, and Fis domain
MLVGMGIELDRRVTETFVELADTLGEDFDVTEFLHALTERCVTLLNADAAGLLLADGRGSLRLVASSTNEAQVLELLQLEEDDGPWVDCYRSGEPVVVSDVSRSEHSQRWPRFTAAATKLGFAGVHAIPMRLREQIIGSVNLFHTHTRGLDEPSARVARALVDVATIGILQERALRHKEMVAEQLQTALNSRVIIEQAKGTLAERLHITPEQAFVALRLHARSHNQRLTALARGIIDGTTTISAAAPPG